MKRRLFIGNLAHTVTREELLEKFTSLLNGHQDCQVGNVEVRCKNEDNYFGFVDVHLSGPLAETDGNAPPPPFLRKCIDLMNNTKWKGCLIKVQLAKESFLDKLKKEREGKTQSTQENKSHEGSNERFSKPRFPKKPDNFDFEIVSNKAKGPHDKELKGEKRKGENSDDDESEDESPEGIPRFRGLAFAYPSGVPDSSNPQDPEADKVEEVIPEVQSISPEEEARFQRLQRIAGYPVGSPTKPKPASKIPAIISPTTVKKVVQKENIVQNIVPVLVVPTPQNDSPKGIVFKKHKQQNSDLLRIQSLEKMKEVKDHRINIVKTSLAQTSNNFNTANENTSKGKKRPQMELFGEEDQEEEDNYDKDFKLKKQFEGSKGRKLLELQGQFGLDDRFNIDERFQDEDDESSNVLPNDEEKRQQMSILSDIIGAPVSLKPTQEQKKSSYNKPLTKNSVILSRYDPEAQKELNDNEQVLQSNQQKEKGRKNKKSEQKPEEDDKESEKVVPEPIRSTEPATYKTASNLKSLFSQDSKTQSTEGGFSLLATFGDEDVNVSSSSTLAVENQTSSTAITNGGAPRQFWQSNPFKYDSSDDEDDVNGEKKKKSAKAVKLPGAPASTPQVDFFFRKNDPRFAGLEAYFMKRDENAVRFDYDEKRKELKSIVKAKARNAKRKDEKRTLAIKRAIRKKRKYRQTLIKGSSSNAVKLGG